MGHKDIEYFTYVALKEMGARPELCGYKLTTVAIKLMFEKMENDLSYGYMNLYTDVAILTGSTENRVERSLRNFITDLCVNNPVDLLEEKLGVCHQKSGIYSTSNFLTALKEYIRFHYLREVH